MSLSAADRQVLRDNLIFYTETSKTGKDFADLIRKIVVRQRLDVIFCDPLLSYVGGDLSKQEVASHFLRNCIQPILKDTGCIIVFTHHRKQAGLGAQARDVQGHVGAAAQAVFDARDAHHRYRGFGADAIDLTVPIAVEHDIAHHQHATL